jgi:hypothetical protein
MGLWGHFGPQAFPGRAGAVTMAQARFPFKARPMSTPTKPNHPPLEELFPGAELISSDAPGTDRPLTAAPKRTAEEQAIIDLMTKSRGRQLTEQEINVSLAQARMIGDL